MKASSVNPLAVACGKFQLPCYTKGKDFIGHTSLGEKTIHLTFGWSLKSITVKEVANLECC